MVPRRESFSAKLACCLEINKSGPLCGPKSVWTNRSLAEVRTVDPTSAIGLGIFSFLGNFGLGNLGIAWEFAVAGGRLISTLVGT